MGAVVKYAKGLSYLLFSESTGFVIEKLISLILEGVRQKKSFCYILGILIFLNILITNLNISLFLII